MTAGEQDEWLSPSEVAISTDVHMTTREKNKRSVHKAFSRQKPKLNFRNSKELKYCPKTAGIW